MAPNFTRELVDVSIPNSLNDVYMSICDNIDAIMVKYNNVLSPIQNSVTKKYIDNGYSEKEAYGMSFMIMILLYLEINGIPIDDMDSNGYNIDNDGTESFLAD